MSFHTAAFFQSTAGIVVNQQINALADQLFTIRSNRFLFSQDLQMLYMAVMAADLTNARLDSPKLRNITNPFMLPVGNAVVPGTEPRVADLQREPLTLPANEELALQVTEATVLGSNITGIFGARISDQPIPGGSVFTLRGTAAGPAVVNTWTDIGDITFTNTLQAGQYAIVGAMVYSATGQGFRINFQGVDGQLERPGGIMGAAEDVQTHRIFRQGRLGLWGTFDNIILPRVEVLANAADAAFVIYWDLIPISGQF